MPAYGGFCASGAPYARKARIGFETFKIVDDRRYFFGGSRSRRDWEMDEQKNIEVGDAFWENEGCPLPVANYKRYTFKVPGYKTDAELDAEYFRRSGAPPAQN